ncbi:hypothetical protein QK887_24920, partial [Salmonella enterica subsp. enterica serovar Oslo]|nr:hypothetical protein [Salmonella enterica subsp. enterica serovar Oslo]
VNASAQSANMLVCRAGEWEQRRNGASYQHISAQGGGHYAQVSATRACAGETLDLLARARMMRRASEGVTRRGIKYGDGVELGT